MSADLTNRLTQARLTLLLDFPFFGQLALRLTPVIDPSVETAATDGREIRFNPDYCAKCNDKQLAWLYAHEVAHPALGHNWRIGPRNPEKYNIAADYVVNAMLAQIIATTPGARNRLQTCPNAYLDSSYDGLSVEQIYQLLPDPQPGSPQPSPLGTFTKPAPDAGKPKPAPSQPQPNPGPADADDETLRQEWQSAAAQAAVVARTRSRGSLPGAITDLLTELFEPAVAWQDILRQFVSRICRDDYTFRRPNRRFAHQGVCLPTLRSESLGTIAVAVDTSGSIRCDSKLLTTFLSELQSILDTTAPETLHLLDCDARVHSHRQYRAGDDLRSTTFSGGGGTNFRPVFTRLDEESITPDCLIYFTDLEGRFPETEPAYPVLWLNYGSPRLTAPFGTTIAVPPNP